MDLDYKSKKMLLACSLAFGLIAVHSLARADTPTGMEKCYGIAKAGQNDCDPISPKCEKSVIDADPNFWIYVPTGACNKIIGGMTIAGSTPSPGTGITNIPPLPPTPTSAPVSTPSTTTNTTTTTGTPGSN